MKTVFRIISLIVILLFTFDASVALSQKKNVKRNVANTSKRKITNKTVVCNFEGTLIYKSIDAHSEAVLKNSFGQAYNGERTYIVTVKGNKMHVYDEKYALHKLYDIPNNVYAVYSEVTRQCVRYNLKEYPLKPYSNDSQIQRIKWRNATPVTYKGDKLQHRVAIFSNFKPEDVNTMGKIQGNINLYASDIIKSPDVITYFFGGINNFGLIKKIVIDHENLNKYVGHMRSVTAMELVALDATIPDDSYFSIPPKIKIKDNDATHKNTISFFDKHLKKMKEAGYTQGEPAQDAMISIKDEWQCVKDWEDIHVELFKQEEPLSSNLLTTILGGLLEVTSSAYDDVRKIKAASEKQTQLAVARTQTSYDSTSYLEKKGNSNESNKTESQKKEKKKSLEYYQKKYDENIERLRKEFIFWSNGKGHGKKNAKGQLVYLRATEVSLPDWGLQSSIYRQIFKLQAEVKRIRRDAERDGWKLAKSILEDAKAEIWHGVITDYGEYKLNR